MEYLGQIKSLLKSGDVAGAEALCRGHHAGRDVSTKRPQADAPWARPCQRIASRKFKIACLRALSFVIFLVPVAALADLIGPWTPPNNYKGFLYEHGYFVGEGLSPVWRGIVYYGIPVFLGSCLLLWVVSRIRKRPFPKNIWEYVVLWAIIVFTVSGGVSWFLIKVRQGMMVVMGAAPPEYSFAIFLDTEEHRAEYDRKCIDYFEQWEFPESLARNAPYRVGRSVPEIRPGAPMSVTNAYLKYREKRDEGFRRIEREKRESKQIPQTEVEPRRQPSQMGGETP